MLGEVFQEFRRLDPQTDMGPPGMGLGLAIVERACNLLGHALDVASEEGRGSCFAVTVPRADAPGDALRDRFGAKGRGCDAADADLSDVIALVVDNEPEVRLGMLSLLGNWGASAVDAGGLEEALRATEELGVPPDVILADYHLDDAGDGLDVIRALRARHGHVPAALITADRSDALARRAGAAQVELMNKPVPPARLRAFLSLAKSG